MADTDEEEDLLKSSDSEDDTIVKENGDEVCDIKEGLQELKKIGLPEYSVPKINNGR